MFGGRRRIVVANADPLNRVRNTDERTLLAELNATIDDDGEDGRGRGRARGRPDDGRDLGMLPGAAAPWRAADPRRRVPPAHVPRRGRTVGCAIRGAPDLVRLDEVRPAVYREAWSLSSAASGRPTSPPPGLTGQRDTRVPRRRESWN